MPEFKKRIAFGYLLSAMSCLMIGGCQKPPAGPAATATGPAGTGATATGPARTGTATVGPGGPAVSSAEVRRELAGLEGDGFKSFADTSWTDLDRQAMTVAWDTFVTRNKHAPESFVPRYRVDHGKVLTITMTWVWVARGANGSRLVSPPGAAVFTVTMPPDLSEVKILPGA